MNPASRPAFYNLLKQLDDLEDAAESKRLLYVAATRAADLLVVSGAEPTGNSSTWLGAFLDHGAGLDVHVHSPTSVDLEALRRENSNQSLKRA